MAEKYTLDEKKALLAKGQAMEPSTEGGDPGYPIGDEADLDDAIKAVGRGAADHDAIRKYIMKVAKKLGMSDKIPDNWQADGSLDESKSIVLQLIADGWRSEIKHSPAELREQFYQDMRDALNDCIAQCYCDPDDDDYCSPWVCDFSDEHVVFECYSANPGRGTWMQSYVTDGEGCVSLVGDPVCVQSHTTYEPIEEDQPQAQNTQGGLTIIAGRSKKPRHTRGLAPAREFRLFAADGLEVRNAPDGTPNCIVITGMPIKYGVGYEVQDMFGSFQETMHRGVCRDVLGSKQADVRFLFNHEGMPLGRTTSGTLLLKEIDDGLQMAVQLDTRQNLANDLAIAIERGDVNQMSCGFVVGRDKWNSSMDERDIFSFKELFDVSAVTYPASPTTSIEIGERMWRSVPVESRARVRRAWSAARELREGKVLSSSNASLLQDAFEVLSQVDTEGLAKGQEHAGKIEAAKTNLGAVLAAATPVGLNQDGTEGSTSGTDGSPSVRKDGSVNTSRQRLLIQEHEDEQRRARLGLKRAA